MIIIVITDLFTAKCHVILEHRGSSTSHVPRFRNWHERKSFRDRHFEPYDIGDKSDLNSFTSLRILFARAARAYPYFSSFHLARKQSWQSRRPLFDLDRTEVEARNPGTFVDRLHLGRRSELPKLGHSRAIIGTSDG